VEPVRQLREQAGTTYVMFNNCFADYAPRNAKQLMSLLDASDSSPDAATPGDGMRGPVQD